MSCFILIKIFLDMVMSQARTQIKPNPHHSRLLLTCETANSEILPKLTLVCLHIG